MSMNMKLRPIFGTIAIAAALGLAACSSKAPETTDNAVDNATVEVPAAENVAVPPPAANTTAPANVAVAAPEPAKPNEAQIQEDADATGMTARLPSSDETAPAAKEEMQK